MSQDTTDRVQVLFIAGSGRSGSTLLDMLLGQVEGFYSTGELRFIWNRGFAENQLCGCGKPFRECEFWTEVIRVGFGNLETVDYKHMEELRVRAEHSVAHGASGQAKPELVTPYQEYYEACQNLYHAVHKISGCEFIVDSSKNTAHGFVLTNMPLIDLFTIHLVRDSRAVAYSWRREKVRPEIYWEQKFMGQRKILSSAMRWNSMQWLSEKLRHRSKQYALLRYEDLVDSPKKSLMDLFDKLRVERPALDFIDGIHANLRTSHTVSGNPVRFTNKEIKIQPDVEWKRAMTWRHRWLVTLVTWPLLLKYGYFRNEGKRQKRATPILLKEN